MTSTAMTKYVFRPGKLSTKRRLTSQAQVDPTTMRLLSRMDCAVREELAARLVFDAAR